MFQVIINRVFVGWEGEKIFSILTTKRLREDVGLREDCEAWKKLICQTIFLCDSHNLIS